MLIFGSHYWRGESGRRYPFNVTLTPRGVPKTGGGIYVFVQRRFVFFMQPLYIGKAVNFRSRHKAHERWWEAYWHRGATERHFMPVKTETERKRIEEDLIRRYSPVMNTVLVPSGKDDAPRDSKLRRMWKWRRKFRLPNLWRAAS